MLSQNTQVAYFFIGNNTNMQPKYNTFRSESGGYWRFVASLNSANGYGNIE